MNRGKLLELFVKASEFKEGDLPVGGTRNGLERSDARHILSTLLLGDISKVDIVEDPVSEFLARSLEKNEEGRLRWKPSMDHSNTNLICGICRQAKHPAVASQEIAGFAARILKERISGVELGRSA